MKLRGSRSVLDESRADQVANKILMDALADARPLDAVLSEEHPDSDLRLRSHRVWIIDPLDGTREYLERRDDWAVHVALAVKGVAEAGAVALPARGEIIATASPPTAPATPFDRRLVLAVSRTRPPQVAKYLADRLSGSLSPMGSAGAKTMAVVRGEVDAYVHAGGQYEWDSCAPVAVARAAGLHASRLDGSPLRYNQPDPYLSDLLVCRPELAELVLRAVASYQQSAPQNQRE